MRLNRFVRYDLERPQRSSEGMREAVIFSHSSVMADTSASSPSTQEPNMCGQEN